MEERDKGKKEKSSRERKQNNSERNAMYAKSAAAVGALTLSLYSTYKASAVYGDVTFHDQLELLLEHVHTILKSSKIWIEEHEKMGDPVPDCMRQDIKRLTQLVDHIQRYFSHFHVEIFFHRTLHTKASMLLGWIPDMKRSWKLLDGIKKANAHYCIYSIFH